ASASRWKRAAASLFRAISASTNFIATRLPMAVLIASYTVPIPPCPMMRTISYLLIRAPTSASGAEGAALAEEEAGSEREDMEGSVRDSARGGIDKLSKK